MNQMFKAKTFIGNFFPYIVIFLLTLITSLVLASNPFSEVLPGNDSSMFMYFGYAMDKGKIMYTEIFDHKGPIIFILNYFGQLLSTTSFSGIYIFEFLSFLFFFIFTYWLSRLWLDDFTAFIPLVVEAIALSFFLAGGNLTEEYALPFIAYGLYVMAKFYKNEKKIISYEIILVAMSFSIVFLLRANMISLWIIACLMIFLEFILAKRYKELLKVITLFIIGMSLIFMPVAGYLITNGALEAGIFQSLIFNFMYLDSHADKEAAIRELYRLLSSQYIVLLFCVYLIFIISRWRRYTQNQKLFAVFILLYSLMSFYFSIISGRAFKHYLMTMIPVMSVPLIYILKELRKNMAIDKLFVTAALVLGIIYNNELFNLYNTIYATNISISTIDKTDGIDRKEEMMLFKAKQKKIAAGISNVIIENTDENDEIYIHRKSGLLYLLSDRLASIKYFNLPAVNINENELIGEDFLREITSADTKLIVLGTNFKNSSKTGTELAFFEFVTGNYQVVYEDRNYVVYSRPD